MSRSCRQPAPGSQPAGLPRHQQMPQDFRAAASRQTVQRRELSKLFLASAAGAVAPSLPGTPPPAAGNSQAASSSKAADSAAPARAASACAFIDVRRYGLVANDRGAATANTTALRALLDPGQAGAA